MRMLPPQPLFTGSRAENSVFDLLQGVFDDEGDSYVALHSFVLSQHAYKRSAEIDFLVCGPEGLYVLEVKGGQVRFDGKQWCYGRGDQPSNYSAEGPFRQAQSACYALKDLLQKKLPEELFAKINFGYGVVLADSRLSPIPIEWDESLLCHGGAHRTIAAWLTEHMAYWQAKSSTTMRLNDVEIQQIVDCLRPKTKVFELYAQVSWAEDRLVELTEQQTLLLDVIEANSRVMCAGAAGTGKTILALELAQRWAQSGDQVLVLCQSEWLKRFLVSRFKLPNVTISTLDGLAMATRRAGVVSYDALIVDEGQDLLCQSFLQIVEQYLQHGLAGGRWVFFHDKNNQSGLFGQFDQGIYDHLKRIADCEVPLNRNCRNTTPIMRSIRAKTQADMGVEASATGPEVAFFSVSGQQQLIQVLDQQITELLEYSGLASSELTVLVDSDEAQFMRGIASQLSHRLVRLDNYSMQSFPPAHISVVGIDAFKGLENTAILLCVSDPPQLTDRQRTLLYVGMSRARVILNVLSVREMINGIM